MKLRNFTLSILLTFSALFVNAQCEIVNGSFEDWSTQDIILPDENGDEVVGQVLLPDSTTSFLRFFFIAFSAAFDPSYAALLENEAQELVGISQSLDASDGEFAVKLETGYGIDVADIYGVFGCNEIPEEFNLDVKHIGETNDTLTVFVLFDDGLSPLPQTEEDLEDVPAYATTKLIYNSDTEYETLNLPVIQNFEADVDTFYYLILAETMDSSYFLIDNVNLGEESSGCTVTAAEISFPANAEPFCVCNEFEFQSGLEYEEGAFFYSQAIIDDQGVIEELDFQGDGLFDSYCPDGGTKSIVVISYENSAQAPSIGDNVNDLGECVEVSNALELEFTIIPLVDLEVFVEGEAQDREFSLCNMDDIMETVTFGVTGEQDKIAILVINEDTEIVEAVYNSTAIQTDLGWLTPGEYVIIIVNYNQTFTIEEGQDIGDFTYEGCFTANEDIYTLTILGEDDGCVTSLDQKYDGNLFVRPNFSTGIFEISNPDNESYTYTVTDMTGMVIKNQKTISNDRTVDLTAYANGIYIISFDVAGTVYRKKIIKI